MNAQSARLLAVLALLIGVAAHPARAASLRVVAWNNLGMHCLDGDYSVFSLLPPYNTIEAQVVRDGQLVVDPAGLVVTYRSVADPDASINTTSRGKTDFWAFASDLFGVSLAPDAGLAGWSMPGPANAPQAMDWDADLRGFLATGIPITPLDDAGRRNPYPLMRIEVRNAATQTLLGSADVVVPVSDEMSCAACHASASKPPARPDHGWVDDPDPERDFRLNVLRIHDDKQGGQALYGALLEARGFDPDGLEATVRNQGRSILCATCHASEALPGSGAEGSPPLTEAIHGYHARTRDPVTLRTLDDETNRSACYSCHPGSVTRCLRGAMGAAVAADGTLAMQCQSCHGRISQVGTPGRAGWLDEPACQSCHTGTATNHRGALRHTSVFDELGAVRTPADPRFATGPDVPLPGFSLYRFSAGHGGLACAACHGSPHAEFPSAERNDNLQSVAAQGHVGVLAECSACHAVTPAAATGGPHGLHPIDAEWARHHGDAAEHGGISACRSCHGGDDRGTVLSRAQGDRTFQTDFGTKQFWRGFQVSCFACHDGPDSESPSPNHPPQVANASAGTDARTPVAILLTASDADGQPLALRIVSQPAHGTVGLAGPIATYLPERGAVGLERFTFAANDGFTDSNLGSVEVTVPEPGAAAGALVAAAALAALARRPGRP